LRSRKFDTCGGNGRSSSGCHVQGLFTGEFDRQHLKKKKKKEILDVLAVLPNPIVL
jgi:hypothetical protein